MKSFYPLYNKILIVTAVCLAVALVVKFRMIKSAETILPEGIEPSSAGKWTEGEGGFIDRPVSVDYQNLLAKHNVFLFPSEQKRGVASAQTEASFTSRYTVKGIMLDSDPVAMIEDSKSKTTWTVYKGQNIGGADIVDIQADRVILDHQGQHIQLMR